jgi:ubiquinone/menaquinone biosynthesis C-methylase UbiE
MKQVLQLKDKVLDNAFMFNLVRGITDSRSHIFKLVKKELNARKNEKILDVGCGLGNFSKVTQGSYTGVDLNKSFIKFAKKNYGSKNRKFFVMDATRLPYKNKSFDKATFLSMLHHFSEKDNQKVLKELARVTKKYIVVLDLLPTKRPIAGFLVKMDRGDHVRPLGKQFKILKKYFKVLRYSKHHALMSSHSLIICKPLK